MLRKRGIPTRAARDTPDLEGVAFRCTVSATAATSLLAPEITAG
jgi:hypothetical protein